MSARRSERTGQTEKQMPSRTVHANSGSTTVDAIAYAGVHEFSRHHLGPVAASRNGHLARP